MHALSVASQSRRAGHEMFDCTPKKRLPDFLPATWKRPAPGCINRRMTRFGRFLKSLRQEQEIL